MTIIKLKRGDWHKANWVFRQLSTDVISEFKNDDELKYMFERAQALGLLSISTMENHLAEKTLQALTKVAEDTIQGKIAGWKQIKPEDKDGQRMYVQCMVELLCLIEEE